MAGHTVKEFVRPIESGQFGDVWEAIDHLDRRVAVKIIKPEMRAAGDALAHAKALAQAIHENVIGVYYVTRCAHPQERDERECIVMELGDGQPLEEVLKGPKISVADVARIGTALLNGLSHIHGLGIAHGDFHDRNVLVAPTSVKVIDLLCRGVNGTHSTASMEVQRAVDIASLTRMLRALLDVCDSPRAIAPLRVNSEREMSLAELRSAFEAAITPDPDVSTPLVDEGYGCSTDYFNSTRIAKAFPGTRGVKEFGDKGEIVERLSILLREPLRFTVADRPRTPIWRFRGKGTLAVRQFRILDEGIVLIGHDELDIRRVVVSRGTDYFNSFVYVECNAMPPTELHDFSAQHIHEMVDELDFATEEYAVFDGRPVTRTEYDDGASVSGGKIIRHKGRAELRVRYLAEISFLIAAQGSVVNEPKFDDRLYDLLRMVRTGELNVSELAKEVEELPKRQDDF